VATNAKNDRLQAPHKLHDIRFGDSSQQLDLS
jgi:hypothetical protein